MKSLWKRINKLNMKKSTKQKLFLTLWSLVCTAVGALAWVTVGRLFLPGIEWLLCFMGYPAMLVGLLGGIIYVGNHDCD